MSKPLPEVALLNKLFRYEPETGVLYWTRWALKASQINKPAGTVNGPYGNRYLAVSIKRCLYKVHRIIWVLQTGKDPGVFYIDHVNGQKLDNRWSNLRLANRSENQTNSNGQAGRLLPKGVWKHNESYRAGCMKNGHRVLTGLYKTPEEAHAAYCKLASSSHGEFFNPGDAHV